MPSGTGGLETRPKAQYLRGQWIREETFLRYQNAFINISWRLQERAAFLLPARSSSGINGTSGEDPRSQLLLLGFHLLLDANSPSLFGCVCVSSNWVDSRCLTLLLPLGICGRETVVSVSAS